MSSSGPAIAMRGVSKSYNRGLAGRRHSTLGELIAHRVRAPLSRPRSEIFWALDDISLEIGQGEVVGIIGRNGAGKSTLLKILSRITEPTRGEIDMFGRVGSLLEVGTGFHAELTGRENIFLNGAILGMTRREIANKFDEIVEFAEVESFLDTPVKRYSSGMYVRLAFAVAAHLNPEILVVDEVLAVGDAAFQRKCLDKMDAVSTSMGKTVLFVSHSMGAVGRLCDRGICLRSGKLEFDGPVDEAIALYTRQLKGAEAILTHDDLEARVRFEMCEAEDGGSWRYGADMAVTVDIISRKPMSDPAVDLAFYADTGARVFAVQSDRIDSSLEGSKVNRFTMEFIVRNAGLACESVSVDVGVRANKDPRYIGWWQRVETLSLSFKQTVPYVAPDILLYLPCRVSVLEAA